MKRLTFFTACAAAIAPAAWAQTTMSPSGSMPPPPPSLNGQPPALEIPRQPPPIPPAGSPLAGVDERAAGVFDCERLTRLGQPLPLDCRPGARSR